MSDFQPPLEERATSELLQIILQPERFELKID